MANVIWFGRHYIEIKRKIAKIAGTDKIFKTYKIKEKFFQMILLVIFITVDCNQAIKTAK